jgi:hypothetical protein
MGFPGIRILTVVAFRGYDNNKFLQAAECLPYEPLSAPSILDSFGRLFTLALQLRVFVYRIFSAIQALYVERDKCVILRGGAAHI